MSLDTLPITRTVTIGRVRRARVVLPRRRNQWRFIVPPCVEVRLPAGDTILLEESDLIVFKVEAGES